MHPQGTPEWLKAREGRITGTSFAESLGEVMKDKEEYPQDEAIKQELFSMGHLGEDIAADIYSEDLPENQVLISVGLAVYKENQALSASPDRVVKCTITGKWLKIVEFKTKSGEISYGLKVELAMIAVGNKPRPAYEVLDLCHYWQLQLQMFVTGVYECDYVTYIPLEARIHIYSLRFSIKHWTRVEFRIAKLTSKLLEKLEEIIPEEIETEVEQ